MDDPMETNYRRDQELIRKCYRAADALQEVIDLRTLGTKHLEDARDYCKELAVHKQEVWN